MDDQRRNRMAGNLVRIVRLPPSLPLSLSLYLQPPSLLDPLLSAKGTLDLRANTVTPLRGR